MTMLWLAVAGALGALARFALAEALAAILGTATPLGAFAANVLGCALFGAIFALAANDRIGPRLEAALLVGFLGAFTTFSTYVADVVALAQAGRPAAACAWVIAHNATGVLALLAGLWLGRAIV